MDNAKKQKIMIAVLVVCALGAGGVWFMNSDSGTAATSSSSGPTTKISRKDNAEEQKTVRKQSARENAAVDEEAATGPVKKSRKEETADAPTKTSRDKTPTKKKDKKNQPAV